MRGYELCLIIHPEASEHDIDTILNGIADIITRNKGTVLKNEKWGKKSLKFIIKKQTKGYYCFVFFTGANNILREIDRSARYNETILRYATIRLDKKFSLESKAEPAIQNADAPAPVSEPAAVTAVGGTLPDEQSDTVDTQ